VIAGNVTSLPEVVGDAGILIDPLNISELSDSIQRLYQEPRFRQSLIRSGLLRAKQFTWEATAERVAQVYGSLVNKSEQGFVVKQAEGAA